MVSAMKTVVTGFLNQTDNAAQIMLDNPQFLIKFGASVFDSDGIKNVSLWGSWDGGWHLDQTNSSGLNDVTYQFVRELSPGNYTWAIGIYDSSGNFALSLNKSISIDYL
jgi:hypothetical protein